MSAQKWISQKIFFSKNIKATGMAPMYKKTREIILKNNTCDLHRCFFYFLRTTQIQIIITKLYRSKFECSLYYIQIFLHDLSNRVRQLC